MYRIADIKSAPTYVLKNRDLSSLAALETDDLSARLSVYLQGFRTGLVLDNRRKSMPSALDNQLLQGTITPTLRMLSADILSLLATTSGSSARVSFPYVFSFFRVTPDMQAAFSKSSPTRFLIDMLFKSAIAQTLDWRYFSRKTAKRMFAKEGEKEDIHAYLVLLNGLMRILVTDALLGKLKIPESDQINVLKALRLPPFTIAQMEALVMAAYSQRDCQVRNGLLCKNLATINAQAAPLLKLMDDDLRDMFRALAQSSHY